MKHSYSNPSKLPTKIKTFGNSMYPLLHDEDMVLINKIKFSNIKVNDILCIKKRNKLITHRVVYKESKYVITKGDNNLYSDGKISEGEVVGIINKFTRDGEEFNLEDIYLLQSTIYFQEAVKIKKALNKANIDFVILKGLPLHLYYYNNHPRRIYADCDILLSRKKLKKVIKIFSDLEYSTRLKGSFAEKIAKHKISESEISFTKTVNGFSTEFDVHFEAVFTTLISGNPDAFYPQETVDKLTNKLLHEKVNIKVQGKTFPVLSPDNLFIYIAMHIFHHKFKPAHRYYLLHELIKHKPDYTKIADTIHKFHLKNFLYPCFALYNKNYQNTIPDFFMESILPSQKILKFTKEKILPLNIFDEQITDTTKKAQYIYNLSPFPIYKKLLFMADPWVFFYAAFIILINILSPKYSNDAK